MKVQFNNLFVRSAVALFVLSLFCVRAHAADGGAKAPMGGSGMYVNDPDAVMKTGSYLTFSTLYDGKRYYLGVDTTRAKAGKDTLAWYQTPNYATMWILGGTFNPAATSVNDVLADQNYLRTLKNVWIGEKCSRSRYLALGEDRGSYSELTLRDSASSTMWYTEKDAREAGKYIQGYLYYYNNSTGTDVYRYLTFNSLHGFSRAYSAKPAASQRISVWDRKTGSDLVFDVHPKTLTMGWETHNNTTTEYSITSQVVYYENVDRFRSRYDQIDVYAARTEPITNQNTLMNPPYNMSGYYEWKSNQTVDPANVNAYDGKSFMKVYTITDYNDNGEPENPEAWTPVWGWKDTTMCRVREDGFTLKENVWYDTIYAVGRAPIDRASVRFLRKPAGGGAPTEGSWANHNDILYIKFTCKGKQYVDSMSVSRHTFHEKYYADLNMSHTPNDHTFPYTYDNKYADGTLITMETDTAFTFTVSADYTAGSTTFNAVNAKVENYVGESTTLNLLGRDGHEEDGVLYDSLVVQAFAADGVTPSDWIESVRLTARNQIRVKVKQSDPSVLANRVAQLRYTYRYWHSSAEGDQATATRTIWLVQQWEGALNDQLYSFFHKNAGESGLQDVHEKKVTMYAIPEETQNLPLHRDLWGYYRWFVYDGAAKDRDVENDGSWGYKTKPTNNLGEEFMPINIATSVTSRGRWDIAIGNPSRFKMNTPTHTPAIENKVPASNSIQVACDVSAYKDIEYEGTLGGVLTSVTEPTLSYRQVFDIQPAATQADKMAGCRTGGNWMERHIVVAPAGRALALSPQYPIAANVSTATEPAYDEDELQYIYWFNPDAVGTEDNNMGKKDGLDITKASSYARIGKTYTAGITKRRARLLTAEEVMNVTESGKKVVVVNAINGGKGFVLGKKEDGFDTKEIGNRTDTATIREWIETYVLNPQQNAYILSIQKTGDNTFAISHVESKARITLSGTVFGVNGFGWADQYWLGGQTTDITLSAYSDAASTAVNSKFSANLVRMHIYLRYKIIAYHTKQGYITGSTESNSSYNNSVHYSEDPVGKASNQAWLFYEIIEPVVPEHRETPKWEMSTDDGDNWTEVAHWDYARGSSVNVSGYNMRPDGSLEIASTVYNKNDVDKTILYRLRTEHFQLVQMTLVLRDPDKEGPKEGSPIISEEEIEANYTVLFDLGMENWPKPGTGSVTPHYHPQPWDFTELSYHYPMSEISERDSVTEMPLKGEYAFLNKFVVPVGGKNTANEGYEYESRAGAANGYMMVVNADTKRTTIMRFDFPQLTCSNQQIYLVGDYCNPVKNSFEPQVTADLEGSNDGIHWRKIYRFKTGKIPYNETNPWYQVALPIARDSLMKYKTFRCSAMLDGATNKNAHLLIDRLRFIERTRPFSVFQSRATCVKDDSVSVLIRIDYQSDPDLYQPGKLVAYQLQKWDDTVNEGKGGYVPMSASRDNGNGTYTALTNETGLEVYPGYVKDAFTATESVEKPFLKSLAGNDYGYVMIPERDYDPSHSDNPAKQSAKRSALVEQAITKLGLTGDAAEARRAFKNEKNNVREFEDVVSHDNLSFGATKTPHIKSYVKEEDEWVIYITCRLPVSATQNNTFRIGMTVMNGLDDTPTFTEESCASFRVLNIKQTVSFLVDGEPWGNHPRAWYDDSDEEHKLLPANETYRTSIKLTVAPTVGSKPTKNPRCKFDLLHASLDVRDSDDDFRAKYGCTRTEFVDAMDAFRVNDDRNVMRDITDWSLVTPADFTRTGRPIEIATAIYNRLNHLVEAGLLEIGLDYRDIYMGDRADSYFYLLPVPATGLFDVTHGNAAGTADTTLHASVCNDTLWLELHSQEPEYKLRYGYDSRVGDTYIVPVIRATRSEANGENGKKLNVRIAYIDDENDKSTVLGWQQTKLVETSDTAWHEAIPAQAFYYEQDKKVTGSALGEYYHIGDTVRFAPKAGTTFRLKAGHWYRFKTAFFGTTARDSYTVDESEEDNIKGHSSFILAIAPDTVRWNPSHPDDANYWNDDANWMPVVNNKDYPDALAKVPMGDSRVIIGKTADESLLPIVTESVVNQKDTLHFGYAKNTCREILFKPQSQILGQEKLNYTKAFVDVVFKSAQWQTFSPALDHIYSGDIYVPKEAGAGNDPDFAPATFENNDFGASHNRTFPYAFYQAYYNSTVPYAFQNTDEEGSPLATETRSPKNSADWVKTNVLDQELKPGNAVALLGFGPTDVEDSSLIVRLPKQENSYHYIGTKKQGYPVGTEVSLTRSAFSDLTGNLAYDKTALTTAGGEGITYHLTNEQASKVFFFGNPTMSLVDVYKLCEDNVGNLEHAGANKYKFTTYLMREGSTYSTEVVDGPGKYFIAPQRAVGLIAAAEATELDIVLKPGAMVAMTGSGTPVHEAAGAPQRRMPAADEQTAAERRLYISASNETNQGLYRAYLTIGEASDAERGFRPGEDALCLASGLNYFDQGSFATPLSMYTIADNRALMFDMRDSINAVPLVFATLEDKLTSKGNQVYTYSDITRLSFALSGNWNEPLYLFDAVSGDSIMIVNGLQIGVPTPQSDQLRYYINGHRKAAASDEPGVATGIENINTEENTANAGPQNTIVYDMLGHRIAVLGEYDLLTTLRLPLGVYLLQRGNRVERIVVK